MKQAVEKALKNVIEMKGSSEDHLKLLTTHNVQRLYHVAMELSGAPIDRSMSRLCSALRNYYYDTNYPGENYVDIDEREALDTFGETKALLAIVNSLL